MGGRDFTDLVSTACCRCSLGTQHVIAAEELASQQIAVILQECQVQIPEIFYVLIFHFQFLRGIPVDNLQRNNW